MYIYIEFIINNRIMGGYTENEKKLSDHNFNY